MTDTYYILCTDIYIYIYMPIKCVNQTIFETQIVNYTGFGGGIDWIKLCEWSVLNILKFTYIYTKKY